MGFFLDKSWRLYDFSAVLDITHIQMATMCREMC